MNYNNVHNGNDEYPGLYRGNERKSLKKRSYFLRQPITIPTYVVPSYPTGYADQFFPETPSLAHRHPTKRLLFEAQMTELIAPGMFQIDDITVFSSIRKDAFCTISKSKGKVLMLAHKIMASHVQLPFYKGNPTIIQNGFLVKIKNLSGACVMTFKRKTLFRPNEADVLEVWFGNKIIPVGKVRKSAFVNEYIVYGDLGQPLYVIYKANSPTNSAISKKHFKYIIHRMEDKEIVGRINCKGRRNFGPLVSGEYPCQVEVKCELDIVQKSLLLGALFLIASRSHSGIERMEEKTRTALDVETQAVNHQLYGIDQQNANDVRVVFGTEMKS